jgi:hypothetical protein
MSSKMAMNEDPFNWPMPKRADLMSLSSLGQRDAPRVKTANYVTRVRDTSKNLDTVDI